MDLDLIRFWRVSSNNCFHGNAFSDFWVLYFVGVPQTKPLHRFSPNFQEMFYLELIRFWRVSSNNCFHGNTFQIFGSYTLWVFQRPKLCIHFHQTFRTCKPQKNLDLIRIWAVPGSKCCHGNTKFWGS